MIGRLLLLGATGDLAGRFLLPALARLSADGRMPDGLQVVGGAVQDWDDRTFRSHVATRLREHAGDVPTAVRDALVGRVRYRAVDTGAAGTVAAAARAFDDGGDAADRAAVAVYLALPPALFPAMLGALVILFADRRRGSWQTSRRWSTLGRSQVVRQRVLVPRSQVRILAPQPSHPIA